VCPCAGPDKDACRIRTQHDPVARAGWPPSIKAKIAKDGKLGPRLRIVRRRRGRPGAEPGIKAARVRSFRVPSLKGAKNAASQTRYCRHCDPGMERRGRRPLIDDAVRNVSARCSCRKPVARPTVHLDSGTRESPHRPCLIAATHRSYRQLGARL
jgi:hypothetical protein